MQFDLNDLRKKLTQRALSGLAYVATFSIVTGILACFSLTITDWQRGIYATGAFLWWMALFFALTALAEKMGVIIISNETTRRLLCYASGTLAFISIIFLLIHSILGFCWYLKFAEWTTYSTFAFLGEAIFTSPANWLHSPDDWIGLHKFLRALLGIVPFGATIFALSIPLFMSLGIDGETANDGKNRSN